MSQTKEPEEPLNKPKQWQNFVAGMVAGFISVSICNPLDIARTRLNVLVSQELCRMLRVTRLTSASIRIFHMQ